MSPQSDEIDPSQDDPDVVAVQAHKWVHAATMKRAILALCRGRFLTTTELAHVLKRSERTRLENYLSQMIKDRDIELRYQAVPGHPDQGYRTAESF